ncbi:hypothetical protein N8340_02105 [Flavobacteriaceae bacterium]|nr:hypothetical protein [Flavobacteriaceae bacterium]
MVSLYYKIKRQLYKKLHLRPDSRPFISGDTFRSISDFIYEDELQKFKYHEVGFKQIVFVASHLLFKFLSEIHPLIKNQYILISHNGDNNIGEEYKKLIDRKVYKFYCQNLLFSGQNIFHIPIGIENKYYFENGILQHFKPGKEKPSLPKVLTAFSLSTNISVREECLNVLSSYKYSTILSNRVSSMDFNNLLRKHMFVASPEGNGLDCHRTWEAIYLGVIPILIKNKFTINFVDLPILLIDKWEDILNFTSQDLNNLYTKIISTKKTDKAFFDYWFNHIKMVEV